MPRIYTNRAKVQGRCYGRLREIQPNTQLEPTIVEVAATVFTLDLGLLLADRPHPKLFECLGVPALVEAYCFPEDIVHAALLLMVEEGTIEYRPDGQIEYMPAVRRQLEREGV